MPHLLCHPSSSCDAIESIHVDIACSSAHCLLHYQVNGNIEALTLPEPRAANRQDGLWQHTCFECFIGTKNQAAYYEYNFSPSSEWAAYGFSGYRVLDTGFVPIEKSPMVKRDISSDQFSLQVQLPTQGWSLIANERPWYINLTAVIELQPGELSYWALHHPCPQPDFHHKNGFIYEIWS